jgi:hypothetical protein
LARGALGARRYRETGEVTLRGRVLLPQQQPPAAQQALAQHRYAPLMGSGQQAWPGQNVVKVQVPDCVSQTPISHVLADPGQSPSLQQSRQSVPQQR